MPLEWVIWPVGIFFLFIGFFVAKARGLSGRHWIFIYLIGILFVLLGWYAGDLGIKYLIDPTQINHNDYQSSIDQIRAFVLFGFGLLGLAVSTQLRIERTEEIGYAFLVGGAIQLIVGVVGMVSDKAVELKFVAVLSGILVLAYLVYKYRDFLLGQVEEPKQAALEPKNPKQR